jgi:uncharacterized protein DUF4440
VSDPDAGAVAAELDALHAGARNHYRARDAAAYMRTFAPDLRYRQADGRVIGWEQLARDVASQLRSVESADTSYVRESLRVEGDRVTEVLRQTASVTTRHLCFLRRVWRVSRQGSYTWVRLPEGWRIQEVEVLSEVVAAD